MMPENISHYTTILADRLRWQKQCQDEYRSLTNNDPQAWDLIATKCYAAGELVVDAMKVIAMTCRYDMDDVNQIIAMAEAMAWTPTNSPESPETTPET